MGATSLRGLGLPSHYICWWGCWRSSKIAHMYATPRDEFEYM